MKGFLLLCMIGTAKLNASSDLKLLDAIAQVESGGDTAAIGPCGARGLYQLSEVVWKRHAPKSWPHFTAHNPSRSQAVALAHIKWLREQLEREPEIGVGCVTDWHLCSAWLRGVNYRHVHESQEKLLARISYCNRVKALLEDAK